MINTIRKAVDAFRSFVEDKTGRASSNTFGWPPKLVYYYLNMVKNAISYEDKMKDSMFQLDEGIILTLPCVKLREVDVVADCPCAPAKGCTWLKTLYKIPRMLTGLPISVSTIDGSVLFDYVAWSQFEDIVTNSRDRAQRIQPFYTIRHMNSEFYIYIYANSKLTESGNLQAIAITGIPNDPLQFFDFPTCGKEKINHCDPLGQEFVLEEELQYPIFLKTFETLINIQNASPMGDNSNNNNNDSRSPQVNQGQG